MEQIKDHATKSSYCIYKIKRICLAQFSIVKAIVCHKGIVMYYNRDNGNNEKLESVANLR